MRYCEWILDEDGIKWDTDCGECHNPYIRGTSRPEVKKDKDGDNVCPYCGKKILYNEDRYNEAQEEEYEDCEGEE